METAIVAIALALLLSREAGSVRVHPYLLEAVRLSDGGFVCTASGRSDFGDPVIYSATHDHRALSMTERRQLRKLERHLSSKRLWYTRLYDQRHSTFII